MNNHQQRFFSAAHHLLLFSHKSPDLMELITYLELENFIVHHVTKINEALLHLKNSHPEIILLDTTRNEIGCLELCHVIKSGVRSRKNIVVLTSDNHDESSEVAAFRAGADDYITKPIRAQALIERLRTRLQDPKDTITVQQEQNSNSQIHIDRSSYTVFADNKSLNLSRKEFELLYLLASQPGKIFRREEVFEKVWKKKLNGPNRTVDVHILRLRKKIGQNSIHTQKGVGYRFNA